MEKSEPASGLERSEELATRNRMRSMQLFTAQTDDFQFYSKYDGKPLEGFKQGSDMIRFIILKMSLATLWRIVKGTREEKGRPITSAVDRVRDDG